jgi:hypothetical protein
VRGVANLGIPVLQRRGQGGAGAWLVHRAQRFGGNMLDPGECVVTGCEQPGNVLLLPQVARVGVGQRIGV